jgi:hypothetical protein
VVDVEIMARTLRAIRITIKRELVNGQLRNIYPDLNQISSSLRESMDWSDYVGYAGIGLHYDSVEGFGEGEDPDIQYVMTATPQAFADEAVSLFSSSVVAMNETSVEDFWNTKAHANEQFNDEDSDVLLAIRAKKDLGIPRNPSDLAALDPDDPTVGIRKNYNKTWARYKNKNAITLV